MASRTHEPEPLLTPAEVASMFRVDPKTVTRWAKAGKLSAIRTLGGHRRYRPLCATNLLPKLSGGVSADRTSTRYQPRRNIGVKHHNQTDKTR